MKEEKEEEEEEEMKVEKFIDSSIKTYKRTLLIEKCVEYTVRHLETDFTVLGYDLITSGSTIIGISSRAVGGPINYPTQITSSEEFREIFGDL